MKPWMNWQVGLGGAPAEPEEGVFIFTKTLSAKAIEDGVYAISCTTADALLYPNTGGALETIVFRLPTGFFMVGVCHQHTEPPEGINDFRVIATAPIETMTCRDFVHWAKMVGQIARSNGEVQTNAVL